MIVVMIVMMIMVVTMAFLTVLMVMVLMIMVVIVTACALVLIDVEVHSGILHRMHHGMLQIAFIDIHDRCHEVEIRLLAGFQALVVLHTHIEIGKIECDPFAVHGN